jgi:hypothetical protein
LVARVIDRVAAERPSKLNRRATGYLRWYPSAWRARYGEEFVAHLEAEIDEHPLSYSRGLNIALHGVTARFRLERGFRWFIGIGLVAALVASLVVGVLASEVRYVALPLSVHSDGGAGTPTRPNTVNNFNFRFTNHSSTRIRLLHVSLVGYKEYPVPRIVRVEFDAHHQKEMAENLSPTAPGLVPAIGRFVILGNDDSIDVSMVAPLKGRLYGVVGLSLQYVRNGVTHTATTPPTEPDLLCVEPRPSESLTSSYCTQSFTKVFALWTFDHVKTPHQTPAQSEALAVTNAAFSGSALGTRTQTTGVSDVREWATRLFAHRGSWKITRITTTSGTGALVDDKHELIFHFDLVMRDTSQRTIVCVQNGTYVSESGYWVVHPPETVACPKPS